jgi:UDP-N-acetyl-D-mannosaminuronic acid dehydrogenase
MADDLLTKIETKTARLAVIGLGYVGLTVACKFAQAGFAVVGIDRLADKVTQIAAGVCPIQGNEPDLARLMKSAITSGSLTVTTDYAAARADVVIVAVETPVTAAHTPDYMALKSALASLGPHLQNGALVIIESTLSPGTMSNVVKPALETRISRKKVGINLHLGHCPERVMPGKLLHNMVTMPRVLGGATPQAAQLMAALYRHIVDAPLDQTDCLTAELVKTTENSYRDVQIAFANEVATICQAAGADVWQVRALVNKVPGRAMLKPGAGVGGHCIPKDSWLLVHGGTSGGAAPLLIPIARQINDNMPLRVADMTIEAIYAAGGRIRNAKIAVLGYAYLENSDDARGSPSQALISRLREVGAIVAVHDPFVCGLDGDMVDVVADASAMVVMVRHDQYLSLDLAALKIHMKRPIIIDGRDVFDPQAARALGYTIRSIGRGN